MNAVQRPTLTPMRSTPSTPRVVGIGVLRALLLAEAVLGLALAIWLSAEAAGLEDALAEQNVRFAAGGAFLFAIFAAVASRGARRRHGWSWTLAALLQLIIAVAAGITILTLAWHPAYLLAFALAATVMLVLSMGSVRRALGQE